jgi:hypothetical protein
MTPGEPANSPVANILRPQPIDENTLRLLDSDQRAVKLMMDYLYEGEYEPKLPAGCASIFGTKPHFTGEMKDDYLYLFPHTCRKALCKTKVCPHHHCSKHRGNVCVHFVCRTCCPTWIPPIPTEPDQLLLHYRMFQIGKRYSVVGLSDLAREKFEQWCEKYWDDDYFLKVGDIVFSSTNKDEQSLKDVVAKTVSNHMCLLNKPTVQDWMQMANGLAVSLVNLRAQDLGWVKPDAAK